MNNKPFSWTFSKLENFENCPKQYYHRYIAKDVREEESEALKWGNYGHKAFELRVKNDTPLPDNLALYEPYMQKLRSMPGKIITEQKLALGEDLTSSGWREAWMRGIVDYVNVQGPNGVIVDYKFGNKKSDMTQLRLCAALVFAKYKRLKFLKLMFLWLKERDYTTTTMSREELPQLWEEIMPRVNRMKHAADAAEYPPKPSGLCNGWCPVKSCEFYNDD